MIAFIDENLDQFGVRVICRTVGAAECGFITSIGYRSAKAGPGSARARCDEILIQELQRIHQDNDSVYGARKMH